MPGLWLREEQADLAVGKILEAAAKAFVDLGVSRTRMGHIAQYAGCSRGTLYRYFSSREQLHRAYIDRSARALSAELATELGDIPDRRERLVEVVLLSVQKVRANPGMAAWFDPRDAGMTARMSHGSDVIEALAATFVERSIDPEHDAGADALRGRWLVRVIVSLLTMPGESEAEERALVEQFVVPGLLDEMS
jgi:AcrR family transcriptional regulator